MWKQPSLRMASANQRKRRVLNTIFQMHKMQLHLPRIQLNYMIFFAYFSVLTFISLFLFFLSL